MNHLKLVHILLSAVTIAHVYAESDLSFNWGVVTRSEQGKEAVIAYNQKINASSELSYRFIIMPETPLYVYIMHRDSEGSINQLGSKIFCSPGTAVTIPSGITWFSPDTTPGTETFYLILTTESDSTLEKLIHIHTKTASRYPVTHPKYSKSSEAVLTRIKTLSRTHSTIASVSLKPVPLAGTVKSLTDTENLIHIETSGYYTREILFVH